jgi:hypothetical protein
MKRLPPDQRRAVIVEAAGRLFGERGYDGTRLDDVAARPASPSRSSIATSPTRKALPGAARAPPRRSGRFVVPAEGTVEERVRAVLEVWLSYVEAHAYAWRMLFRDTGGGRRSRRSGSRSTRGRALCSRA